MEEEKMYPVGEAGEHALARAVLYRWIATSFRYPTPELDAELRDLTEGAREAVRGLQEGGGNDLTDRLQGLLGALEETTLDERESEHVRLFGHIPQGDCPPYEGEYAESEERLQQPHELGDLSGMYEAFGLKLAEGAHERFDYLPVECEFMCFLATKEEHARAQEDGELLRVTLEGERLFLRNHLARWLPAFCRRLIDKAGEGYLSVLSRFALAFLRDECRRFEVEPGTERLRLRKLGESPEEAVSCPMDARSPASPVIEV